MEVGIVGCSGSGLPLSVFLKQKHPDWNLTLIDHNAKVGKKLSATGNGHCNLLNATAEPSNYNNPDFLKPFFQAYPLNSVLNRLLEIGVSTVNNGDLIYPKSLSAPGYVNSLEGLSRKLGNSFCLNTSVTDYKKSRNKWVLVTSCGEKEFDKVIFCCGGSSGLHLGSDGSLLPVFKKHGYKIVPLAPGLGPVRTKEPTTSLNGLRHKAEVSLIKNGKTVKKETGEVLFRKNGVSGIVIFNLERLMAPSFDKEKYRLLLDLFPEESVEDLGNGLLALQKANPEFSSSFLPLPLFNYVLCRSGANNLESSSACLAFAKAAKSLSFEVVGLPSFEESQVTCGGIDVSFMNDKLESAIEPGVHFLGEILDVDGPCGGYNLQWCLISALALTDRV